VGPTQLLLLDPKLQETVASEKHVADSGGRHSSMLLPSVNMPQSFNPKPQRPYLGNHVSKALEPAEPRGERRDEAHAAVLDLPVHLHCICSHRPQFPLPGPSPARPLEASAPAGVRALGPRPCLCLYLMPPPTPAPPPLLPHSVRGARVGTGPEGEGRLRAHAVERQHS